MFWKTRPDIRPMEASDKKWIRVAQKLNNAEMSAAEFEAHLQETLGMYQEALIAEDDNNQFESGKGPVAVIVAHTNGYLYEPHVQYFPWATIRNKLRVSVSFFQKFRYRNLGVIRVHALESSATFFRKLRKYVPLFYVGKIPGGDREGRGDDYIFYMKCRGNK